jgi:ATP-dependent Lon protease
MSRSSLFCLSLLRRPHLSSGAIRRGSGKNSSRKPVEISSNYGLMHGKDAHDLGVAFFVGLVSAVLSRTGAAGLVVLGEMSLHGVLSHVEGLGDKLRVAMDSGARRVMIPTVNRKDFATLPDEVIDKMQIEFYSDPAQAAFKALTEG